VPPPAGRIRRRAPGAWLLLHALGDAGDELVLLDSRRLPYGLAQRPLSDDQLLDLLGAFEDVEDLQCSLEQSADLDLILVAVQPVAERLQL
jgi:hypothetical protein